MKKKQNDKGDQKKKHTTWRLKKDYRHNPPGILEWIVDVFVGAFGPVLEKVVSIVTEHDNEKLKADAVKVSTAAAEALDTLRAGRSPLTPAEALDDAKKFIQKAIDNWGTMDSSIMYASAIPFIDLETWLLHRYRDPRVATFFDYSSNIFRSEYTYFLEPLLRRYWLKERVPFLPEPYRLALAVSKGILADEKFKEAMSESGQSAEWADMWREENYLYPTLETALMLLRRGEISEDDFNLWLERSQVPKEVHVKVRSLKDVIPPIQDLRLMAVREAWEGLTYEQTWDKYKLWADKMGIGPDWAEAYRRAAWRRMDVREAMRFFLWYHDLPDEYQTWMRIADIHEDDRSRIAEVSYTLPSIREMGYGFDMGVYTEDDIVAIRRRGGLNPIDAVKAGRSLVAYRISAEREALRREHLHLFAVEKIDEAEFKRRLEELVTPAEAVSLWIERGKLERERKRKPPVEFVPRGITRSTAQWLFEHGVQDETWFRETLVDLDTAPEAVEAYVAQSKQRIKEREKPPVEVTYRNLTVTQIRDLWRMKKIGAVEVPAFLEEIGFSAEDAERVAQLLIYVPEVIVEPQRLTRADVSRMYDMRVYTEKQVSEYYKKLGYLTEDVQALTLWTKLSVEFPDLKTMYGKGWINADALVEELVRLGLSRERAQEWAMTVVKAEQPARVMRERDLTKAEILKGLRVKLIDRMGAVELLMDLGYDEWEAYYILEVNRVVTAGDPEGYWDMKKVVNAYKRMRGEKVAEIPDEVITLERQIREQTLRLAEMRERGESERRIAEAVNVKAGLEHRLRQLLIQKKLAKGT